MKALKLFIFFIILAPLTITYAYQLTFTEPTTNTDGTLLTNCASYNIYMSYTTGSYGPATLIDTMPCSGVTPPLQNSLMYTGADPAPGIYFFVVSTSNILGEEGPISNEVSRFFPSGSIPAAPIVESIN